MPEVVGWAAWFRAWLAARFTGIRTPRSLTALVLPLFLVSVPVRVPTALTLPLPAAKRFTVYWPAKVAPFLASPVTLWTFRVPNSLVMELADAADAAGALAPPTRATMARLTATASDLVVRPNIWFSFSGASPTRPLRPSRPSGAGASPCGRATYAGRLSTEGG